MSTDGESRVDQYFVKCYTEVYIRIRYRSNLNRKAAESPINDQRCAASDKPYTKKSSKNKSGAWITVIHMGEPPEGEFVHFYIYIVSRAACAASLRQSRYYSFTHEHQCNESDVNNTPTIIFTHGLLFLKHLK